VSVIKDRQAVFLHGWGRLPQGRAIPILSFSVDSPVSHSPGVGWLRLAGARLRALWLAKLIGMPLGMTVFFAAYFWLLTHERHPVTNMPLIFIDRMVRFEPWALGLYVSLWFYVVLAPSLISSRRELVSYAWAAAAMSAFGFATFILWPTAVPIAEFGASANSSLAYLKGVDASGNAFPSLHVAFAVFTAIWLERLLRGIGAGASVRAFNILWCLGIVYSTVAIRQHVALDAIAGALLGGAAAAVQLRILGPMSE
jgi:membrane-associated phospholipid phosphatase